MNDTIGIDISKDTLDVHCLSDGEHTQFLNSKTGHLQLRKWIGLQPASVIIFEATGAYHRQLEQALGSNAIPFVKVNPKQARRFAQANGKLAKTDRVDCEMLAKMGAALQLVPKPICAENLYDLRELLSARQALVKDRIAAKAPTGEALKYIAKYWDRLSLFLDDGRIELESNPVERTIRPIALKRALRRSRCGHTKLGHHRVPDRNLQTQRDRTAWLFARRPDGNC